MRLTTDGIEIRISQIPTSTKIGTITTLAHRLGYDIAISAGNEYDGEDENVTYVRLVRNATTSAGSEIAALAALIGYLDGVSGNELRDWFGKQLDAIGYPADRSIKDDVTVIESQDTPQS